MQIRVDDTENFALKSNPSTLGAALIELTEYVQSQGRAMQTIAVDGVNLAPEELTVTLGNRSLSDIETVEVASASIEDLVTNTLDEIAGVIPELPAACHELAQVLASENPAACFAQFNQLLDIWEVLKERQGQVIATKGVLAEQVVFGKTNASVHNQALDALILKARGYMEASKFAELSDLLSHDLVAMAESEADLVNALR